LDLLLQATTGVRRVPSSRTFGIHSRFQRAASGNHDCFESALQDRTVVSDPHQAVSQLKTNRSTPIKEEFRVKWYVNSAAVALLSSSLLCSTAVAAGTDKDAFSAVQGVNAQALSLDEMQATSGQLNAYDIAAALTAAATKLAKYPKLQQADLKLANWYQVNAVAINAEFQKLGILTPCKSCK
jgi:hypothetical protein